MSREDAILRSDRILQDDPKGSGLQLLLVSTTALVCACDFSHCQTRCRFVSLNAFCRAQKMTVEQKHYCRGFPATVALLHSAEHEHAIT